MMNDTMNGNNTISYATGAAGSGGIAAKSNFLSNIASDANIERHPAKEKIYSKSK